MLVMLRNRQPIGLIDVLTARRTAIINAVRGRSRRDQLLLTSCLLRSRHSFS
jgi:hypothetical protein